MQYKIGKLLMLMLLLPALCAAQKYALIDRGWQKPVMFVDTVTKEQLKKGWYPIYTNEMDTLIKVIDNFTTIFKKGMKRSYLDNSDYRTPNIEVNIVSVQQAYGDRYDVDMTSTTDIAKVTLRLSNSQISNRHNQQHIKLFYYYLQKYNKIKNQ